MRIELNCDQCGSNRFSIRRASSDDARIACEDCEHDIGTLAELKERVAAEVLRRRAVRPSHDD
ncbi:MAG TPA: hypothetical protein VM308_07955 [Sphingomicrobium sp.]|nr:hypothetical protein [Sphingomicrobium sp.]